MNVDCRMCRSAFVRRHGHRDGYVYVECADCGFVFSPSMRRGPAAEPVATPMPDAEAAFLEPAFERLGHGRLLYLLIFGGEHRTLPGRLRQDGHRVIEVSYTAPRRPHRDRLTGDLLEMNLVPGQFDLVYAGRVLERLPAPRPVLDELLRLTRTGGLVAIHTDLDGPPRPTASFGDGAPSTAPTPRSYFRRRTFEKVLEKSACTTVETHPHLVLIEVRRRAGVRNASSTAGFQRDKVIERR